MSARLAQDSRNFSTAFTAVAARHFFNQVKIAAMTVNGSGPATPWMEEVTYAADLDESAVPDTPSSLKAKVGDACAALSLLGRLTRYEFEFEDNI